jgi:20S proteasome subunit beta 6
LKLKAWHTALQAVQRRNPGATLKLHRQTTDFLYESRSILSIIYYYSFVLYLSEWLLHLEPTCFPHQTQPILFVKVYRLHLEFKNEDSHRKLACLSNHQRLNLDRYADNGGSTLGIAGKDFTILAGDTRMSSGYSINTRYAPKVFRIGGDDETGEGARMVLAVTGFAADGNALKERLDAVVKMYKYQHGKDMSVKACAQRLATILYQKRFFPYYTQAILGGLDEEGKGALYSYDYVGSYEREQCRAVGAAASLMMPFLDNQVNLKNQYEPGSGQGHDLQAKVAVPLPREHVEQLVRDAFTGAVERHIEVGDGLQMLVVTADGIHEVFSPLKRD